MFISNHSSGTQFYSLIGNCKEKIRLVMPFMASDELDQILEARPKNVPLELVTGYDIEDLFRRETHLEAVEKLVRNKDKVIGIPGLQGSFCLFDQQHALVRSGPIMKFGDWAERDYGVFVHNRGAIQSMLRDYENLLNNVESKVIDAQRIQAIEETLKGLGLESGPLHRITREEAKTKYGVSGWTFDVLNCVTQIKEEIFLLKDAYQFEKQLALLHPGNNNVKAKIRQQLQVLRDKGLIRFLERGRYRKIGALRKL